MKRYELVNALKCIAKSYIAEQHEIPISQLVFEYIALNETREYKRTYCHEQISINDIVTDALSFFEKEYDLDSIEIHIDIPNGYQYYYKKLNATSEWLANECVKDMILGPFNKDKDDNDDKDDEK